MINVLMVIVILCLVGWWWCWRTPCESCEDDIDAALLDPTIEFQNEEVAVWQAIDNNFTLADDGSGPQDRYFGVLFQNGYFVNEYCQSLLGAPLVDITWKSSETGEETTETYGALNDYIWINVVPESAVAMAEGFSDWVYLLYPSKKYPEESLGCSGTDPGTTCAQLPCTDSKDTCNGYGDCLRRRSLRAHFVPTAVMTYWMGENGYRLDAGYVGNSPPLTTRTASHIFRLQDPVVVFVWKEDPETGKPVLAGKYSDVSKIYVHNPGTGDGEIHWPPIGGGTVSFVEGDPNDGETIEQLP